MIKNALIILNSVNFDPQYPIIEGRRSVLHTTKKDLGCQGIVKRSTMSQKTDSRSVLVNILIKRPPAILQILKKWNQVQTMIWTMEALIINVLSSSSTNFNNENSKAYFILLGLVKKVEEMATALTNGSFNHSLFTIGKVSPNSTCNIINLNFFIYITTYKYLSDKFYRIMIDNNATKHFIADYGQYMAYISDIKDTTIDISQAGVIHI